MGTRWSVVLMAAGVLAVATGMVSCATLKGGGGDPKKKIVDGRATLGGVQFASPQSGQWATPASGA